MEMRAIQFHSLVVVLIAAVMCLQYGQAHNTHRLNNDNRLRHHDKRDVWYGEFEFDHEPVEQDSLQKSYQNEPLSGHPSVSFLIKFLRRNNLFSHFAH